MTAEEKRALDEQGYVVIHGLIDSAWLEKLRAAFDAFSPEEKTGTRHVDKLTERDPIFGAILSHPKLAAAAQHILARPHRLLHLSGRDPLPGFGRQGLHADWYPRTPHAPFEVVTSIWMLDDFTASNGATRIVPGTHPLPGPVPKSFADPASRHPQQQFVVAPAGSVLIFNGHLWHSGARNNSSGRRRALQCQLVADQRKGNL